MTACGWSSALFVYPGPLIGVRGDEVGNSGNSRPVPGSEDIPSPVIRHLDTGSSILVYQNLKCIAQILEMSLQIALNLPIPGKS